MIIFDLKGVLADDSHRRHFIDPSKRDDCYFHFPATLTQSEGWYYKDKGDRTFEKHFEPDWRAYYDACDKDEPIEPVIEIICSLHGMDYYAKCEDVQIWTSRCESTKDKTQQWLNEQYITYSYNGLKMRPIGNTEPIHILKERWLNEQCADLMDMHIYGKNPVRHNINFVFDANRDSIAMWRRRGIFCFDCRQS